MKEKVKTYINFAIKSGEYAMGTEKILKLKRADLILTSPMLSKNAIDKIKNKDIGKIIVVDRVLPNGVKAMAILNSNLAKAIVDELD